MRGGGMGFVDWATSPEGKVVLAGALGGLARTLTLRDNWREGAANIAVGSICALYLHPLAIPMLEPIFGKLTANPESLRGLAGMVVGISGMALVGFLLDIAKAKRGGRT